MRSLAHLAVIAGLLLAAAGAIAEAYPRVEALDIHVDSGAAPLAAWQIELTERNGRMTVVGVENGADAAFAEPPYYDRAAVHAAYETVFEPYMPSGIAQGVFVRIRYNFELVGPMPGVSG